MQGIVTKRKNKETMMTDRKKKGIGFLISAVAFGIAGSFLVFATQTPVWVAQALDIVAIVAAALGFVIVFPDKES